MSEQLRSRELTPEEEKKPYAKYFYRDPAPPEPEAMARMQNPMDPSKALPIENINDLLDPGYHDVEAGWCALPQGGLYIANHLKMPGVTVEMINWWFWWHSLEDLRYKIWFPPGHSGISVSDRDRAIILDPQTPTTHRFQGRTHYVLEDVGGPCAEKIAISFMTPEDIGFDMDRFKSPNVETVAGLLFHSASRRAEVQAQPFVLFISELSAAASSFAPILVGVTHSGQKTPLLASGNRFYSAMVAMGGANTMCSRFLHSESVCLRDLTRSPPGPLNRIFNEYLLQIKEGEKWERKYSLT